MGLGEFLFKVISFKIDFFKLFNHCVRKFGAAFLCLRFPWVVYKNFVAHKSNYFLVFNFSFSNPLYHMYQLVRALRDWPISVVSRILKHSLLQLMFFDTDFLPMSATSPSKFANAYKTYGLWVDSSPGRPHNVYGGSRGWWVGKRASPSSFPSHLARRH